MKNNIVLHVCCAPCMIYPLEELKKQDFEVSGFFYNPNIQPFDEFEKRKNNVLEYSQQTGCAVRFDAGYDSDGFFNSFESLQIGDSRCHKCWYLRLKKTAEYAKKINAGYFTTTLLVSPYQDREMIGKLGEKVADATGIKFHFEDFSSGYRYSVEVSRAENMYRQKYCGCLISKDEAQAQREQRKKNKKNKGSK